MKLGESGEAWLFDSNNKLILVKDDTEIILVSSVDVVLKHALTKELKPVDWVEVETFSETGKDDKAPVSAH